MTFLTFVESGSWLQLPDSMDIESDVEVTNSCQWGPPGGPNKQTKAWDSLLGPKSQERKKENPGAGTARISLTSSGIPQKRECSESSKNQNFGTRPKALPKQIQHKE